MGARAAIAAVVLALSAVGLTACNSGQQCPSAAGYVDMKGGGGGGGGGHASGGGAHVSSGGAHVSEEAPAAGRPAPAPIFPFFGSHTSSGGGSCPAAKK